MNSTVGQSGKKTFAKLPLTLMFFTCFIVVRLLVRSLVGSECRLIHCLASPF